ncbi:MAG: hypothetical protein JO308_17270 [Verrucomicrobia bacterium]|nr:hypothetical protein [Verrucomicrobiota bacterium]
MQSNVHAKERVSLLDLLALCIVFGLSIGALAVRDAFPIVPFADGDTWGFLYPALNWLSGLGFQQTSGRDWFYPAILAGIVNISSDFRWITVVQRVLGSLGVFLFWLTYRRWFDLLPAKKPILRAVCFTSSLGLLALYALSPQQALLENSIRPEGILAFFEMSFLYCLVSFFRARWQSRLTSSTIAFGSATIGLSYALWLLKPSWTVSLILTILCMATFAFGRATLLIRLGPLLAGSGVFLLLFAAPSLLKFQKGAQSFLPLSLVAIHAPQILEGHSDSIGFTESDSGLTYVNLYEELDSAYQALVGDPDSNLVHASFYEDLGKAYQTAKLQDHHFDTLGFDPDYILYRSGFFAAIRERESWTDRELADTCYSAYLGAWCQAPSGMAKKVWIQAQLFLFPHAKDFYKMPESMNLSRELTSSVSCLPAAEFSPRISSSYHSYLQNLQIAHDKVGPPGWRCLATLASYVARLALPLQLAFFAATIAALVSRKRQSLRLAGLVAAAVLAATYGIVLGIAIGHSLDVCRYRVSYAPGFLLGLAMITTYLLLFAFGAHTSVKQTTRTNM